MAADLLTSLQNLCAGRECCTFQVREKLRRAGVTGGEAEEILQELKRGKWVDDRRYAGCYAREKSELSGWGAARIRYCLSLKKIAPDDIASAIESIERPAADRRMQEVLGQKWNELCRKEADGRKRRAKMLRFAFGRGYSAEDVGAVIGRWNADWRAEELADDGLYDITL